MQILDFICTGETSRRIDAYLAECMDATRSHIAALVEAGNVSLNGKPVPKSVKVKAGDKIQVMVPNPVSLDVAAEDIPLQIVYEDNCLLVVNKPKGMVVHPAAGNHNGIFTRSRIIRTRLEHRSGSNRICTNCSEPRIGKAGFYCLYNLCTELSALTVNNQYVHKLTSSELIV